MKGPVAMPCRRATSNASHFFFKPTIETKQPERSKKKKQERGTLSQVGPWGCGDMREWRSILPFWNAHSDILEVPLVGIL